MALLTLAVGAAAAVASANGGFQLHVHDARIPTRMMKAPSDESPPPELNVGDHVRWFDGEARRVVVLLQYDGFGPHADGPPEAGLERAMEATMETLSLHVLDECATPEDDGAAEYWPAVGRCLATARPAETLVAGLLTDGKAGHVRVFAFVDLPAATGLKEGSHVIVARVDSIGLGQFAGDGRRPTMLSRPVEIVVGPPRDAAEALLAQYRRASEAKLRGDCAGALDLLRPVIADAPTRLAVPLRRLAAEWCDECDDLPCALGYYREALALMPASDDPAGGAMVADAFRAARRQRLEGQVRRLEAEAAAEAAAAKP